MLGSMSEEAPSKGSNNAFRVLIHGGAGVISNTDPQKTETYLTALRSHVLAIAAFINRSSNVSALDIAEYAVKLLEDDHLFNAGRGAVFTTAATHELEASIMCGLTRQSGAVSLIKHIQNPISVARLVLAHPAHCYFAGEGAEQLARDAGLPAVPNSFFDDSVRLAQLHSAQKHHQVTLDHTAEGQPTLDHGRGDKTGTVGCVVMYQGNVAAATSTGGMTNKLCGRIGDSPLIGAGTFADNRTAAVSCTGVGEDFIRHVAAYDVSARMAYGGQCLKDALHSTLFEHLPMDTGGAIAVTAAGDFAADFNTLGMYRGMLGSDGSASVGIWNEEEAFTWRA